RDGAVMLDGRRVALDPATGDPTRWETSFASVASPVSVTMGSLRSADEGPSARHVCVAVRATDPAVRIDRVVIDYHLGSAARISLASGGSVAVSAGWEFFVDVFGVGPGGGQDARTIELENPSAPIEVAVQVYLMDDPRRLEVAPPPADATLRRRVVVS